MARAFWDGGCDLVLVVVRELESPEARLADTLGLTLVLNPDPQDGPITSLRAALAELPVDVAEQGLPLVEGGELHLHLEPDAALEGLRGAAEDVELGTLGVELEEGDVRLALGAHPGVEGRDLDLHAAVRRPHAIEVGVASGEPGHDRKE